LKAFTSEQELLVAELLAEQVRHLLIVRGHYEEYHWASLYRAAKGAPRGTWSNLQFRDFIHEGIGVEWKILGSDAPSAAMGRSVMHPSGTRRIEFDPTESADSCKERILTQWCRAMDEFEARVRAHGKSPRAEIRWGVLLWGRDLGEFLYFEEPMIRPRHADYDARWETRTGRGKQTQSLYIYEKRTGKKRFSVTHPSQGAKLQPYFDVPVSRSDVHLFSVKSADVYPIWVSEETRAALRERIGDTDMDGGLRRLLSQAGDQPTQHGDR